MPGSKIPLLAKIRQYSWLVFAVLGLYPLTWSLGLCVPCFPGHWDWLTKDVEVLRYLATTWRLTSFLSLGVALFTVAVAATAYRHGEKWAWYAFWYWPVFLAIYIPTMHPWTWPITVPFLVASVLAQVASAPPRAHPQSAF